jgi:methionine-rich copper-binding protein CopC
MHRSFVASIAAYLFVLPGCAQGPVAAATSATSEVILAGIAPAAGSTVKGPIEELTFRFARPARLMELTVNGPDGAMPVMISPVGETTDYSIPVSSLDTGAYTVDWRAASAGRDYRGSFSFTVK